VSSIEHASRPRRTDFATEIGWGSTPTDSNVIRSAQIAFTKNDVTRLLVMIMNP
jgi:hypothetical protein